MWRRYRFLIQPVPLTNFEIQKYYQSKPTFNNVYSGNNLPKIKNGAYVINLDEYSDIETHWVALWLYNKNVFVFFVFFYDLLMLLMLLILIVLGWKNIFPKLLKHLLVIKTVKQIFQEYRRLIQ